MQHTTSAYYPSVGITFGCFHSQGQVLLQFLGQTVSNVAAGAVFTFLSKEGRVVDGEEHTHSRLVYADRRQWLWVLEVTDGISNLEVLQAHNGTDVTTRDLLSFLAAHTRKGVQFLDFCLLLAAVAMGNSDVHTLLQGAPVYATHGNTSCIVAIVEAGNQHLRRTLQHFGSRNILQNAVQQVSNIIRRLAPVLAHPSVLGRAIDNGEVQLVLCGIQVAHQVEDHLVHLFGSTVGLIHLVDDHHRLQTYLQGLLQHEACLRHRTLEGIHQQQAAVGHIQHTLHLATEIAMPRSVDNIDLCVLIVNTNVLRKDGDSALTLQLIVIQHQFTCLLVLAEEVTSQQHLVHQRSLSVVYVGNDGYVPNTLHTIFYKSGDKVTNK